MLWINSDTVETELESTAVEGRERRRRRRLVSCMSLNDKNVRAIEQPRTLYSRRVSLGVIRKRSECGSMERQLFVPLVAYIMYFRSAYNNNNNSDAESTIRELCLALWEFSSLDLSEHRSRGCWSKIHIQDRRCGEKKWFRTKATVITSYNILWAWKWSLKSIFRPKIIYLQFNNADTN